MVPVDDASLQQAAWFTQGCPTDEVPQWARGLNTLPWPRAAYGQLSERLLQAGASAVAINVVFEGASGKGPADDAAMAALLAEHRGRVAVAAEMLEPEDSRGAGGLNLVLPEVYLEALTGPGRLGLTNTLAAQPGQPLRHPEAYSGGLLRSQGVLAPPSLANALLQQAGRRSRQGDARMDLNVYGPEGTFTRLPAWEVLDPERWRGHALKPALKDALVVVITEHGGTIDKFMGDAVMAVFGSPVSRGARQEAEAAVRCALAMEVRLCELNAAWRQEAEAEANANAEGADEVFQPLANGVGLASGPVVAGQIGSPQRLEFTVIGDTVNLASRLEGLTRRVATLVCMDTNTARLVEVT